MNCTGFHLFGARRDQFRLIHTRKLRSEVVDCLVLAKVCFVVLFVYLFFFSDDFCAIIIVSSIRVARLPESTSCLVHFSK